MENKSDHNKDGVVNYLDDITYLTRLFGPYFLILVGLFAPIPENTRQWVIAGGLGLAGTERKETKEEVMIYPKIETNEGPDAGQDLWY